eukprot:1092070-Amphidinium_carterae.1
MVLTDYDASVRNKAATEITSHHLTTADTKWWSKSRGISASCREMLAKPESHRRSSPNLHVRLIPNSMHTIGRDACQTSVR